ncbi:hypothetical protein [Clostridium sp.]|uniref:hypothetical protein n=1 Tax=Clostridium sp. TaxID=1506 RepID=UPI003D6C8EF2
MNDDKKINKDTNEENSEIINNLYSNIKKSKEQDSNAEHNVFSKLKRSDESGKYIKEMHDLSDKNELKNNLIVLGLFIVVVAIIIFSILMNTPFMKPKTDAVATKIVTKDTIDNTAKPIATHQKVYEFLNIKTNRLSSLKKAIQLNGGSKTGTTVYVLSEVLRSNAIAVPKDTSTVKQLVIDLTALGWNKNTDVTKLEKGDICFTTHMPNKADTPSHSYVFMGWIEDGKTDYANICDGQIQNNGDILHKRNISISVDDKDKFSFFLRK